MKSLAIVDQHAKVRFAVLRGFHGWHAKDGNRRHTQQEKLFWGIIDARCTMQEAARVR